MGEQRCTETAASVRNGCEDALDEILAWQERQHVSGARSAKETPSPIIVDGYWADFDDLQRTFPEDWARFSESERRLFARLWDRRTHGLLGTACWYAREQVRLLSPRIVRDIGLRAWLIYIPLQVVALTTLVAFLVRYPRVLTRTLGDVRLYADPKGMVERAIVQRIDRRVRDGFLRLIGLDGEFRPLRAEDLPRAGGEALEIERVVWVAHSLGTVVSYNVLSDLFHKAE